LSQAESNALGQAAKLFSNFVKRILLDNCNVEDRQFGKILESLSMLGDFKSIIYRHNEFEMESAKAIRWLLWKRVPYHLEELRIEHCQMSPQTTAYLLDELEHKSYLRKLVLVNVGLNEKCMTNLCSFIATNKYIECLDVSWNRLMPDKWLGFLTHLEGDRRLRDVNLSWNQLLPTCKKAAQSVGAQQSKDAQLSRSLSQMKTQ